MSGLSVRLPAKTPTARPASKTRRASGISSSPEEHPPQESRPRRKAIRLHGFRRDALQFLPQKRRAGGENKPAVWFHTVFRIVPAELAVMDDAAQITELVAVRLGAANQKCDAAPPKLRAVPL